MLVMVMVKLHKNTSVGTVKQLNHARIALASITLFGLTWVLAIFAIDNGGYFFQVIFCVLSSLQGFFIFAFFVILNKSARGEWAIFITWTKQKVGSSDQLQMVTKGNSQVSPVSKQELKVFNGL